MEQTGALNELLPVSPHVVATEDVLSPKSRTRHEPHHLESIPNTINTADGKMVDKWTVAMCDE